MFRQRSQALLNEALAEAFDGRAPHSERLGNRAVLPTLRRFEDDAGAGHFAGRMRATMQQVFKLLTFIVIKRDKIFFSWASLVILL
jgi:hypothetical protein